MTKAIKLVWAGAGGSGDGIALVVMKKFPPTLARPYQVSFLLLEANYKFEGLSNGCCDLLICAEMLGFQTLSRELLRK